MGKHYEQLSAEERNMIQTGLNEHLSLREISRRLGRSASTVSREYHAPRSRSDVCSMYPAYT